MYIQNYLPLCKGMDYHSDSIMNKYTASLFLNQKAFFVNKIDPRRKAIITTYKILLEAQRVQYALTGDQISVLREQAKIIVKHSKKTPFVQKKKINLNPFSTFGFWSWEQVNPCLVQVRQAISNNLLQHISSVNPPSYKKADPETVEEECIIFAALLYIQFTQDSSEERNEAIRKIFNDFCGTLAEDMPSLGNWETAANYDVKPYLQKLARAYNQQRLPQEIELVYQDLRPRCAIIDKSKCSLPSNLASCA